MNETNYYARLEGVPQGAHGRRAALARSGNDSVASSIQLEPDGRDGARPPRDRSTVAARLARTSCPARRPVAMTQGRRDARHVGQRVEGVRDHAIVGQRHPPDFRIGIAAGVTDCHHHVLGQDQRLSRARPLPRTVRSNRAPVGDAGHGQGRRSWPGATCSLGRVSYYATMGVAHGQVGHSWRNTEDAPVSGDTQAYGIWAELVAASAVDRGDRERIACRYTEDSFDDHGTFGTAEETVRRSLPRRGPGASCTTRSAAASTSAASSTGPQSTTTSGCTATTWRLEGSWKLAYRRVLPDAVPAGDDPGAYWPDQSVEKGPRGQGFKRGPVVGEAGLEPAHPFGHRNLNPARLPIPPLARVTGQE